MGTKYSQTFSIDQELDAFITDQKFVFKKSKSWIIRKVFDFFKENPDELKKIIEKKKRGD